MSAYNAFIAKIHELNTENAKLRAEKAQIRAAIEKLRAERENLLALLKAARIRQRLRHEFDMPFDFDRELALCREIETP